MTNETHTATEAGELRQIHVHRTYLIRRTQQWTVDIPAAYDTDEWKVNDLSGLDDYVTDNGDLLHEDYEHVDCDELDLEVSTGQVQASTPAAAPRTLPFAVTRTKGRDGYGWTITTTATLSDIEATQITFRAEAHQVVMGEYVEVVDAEGTRIGHIGGATYHERWDGPAYVTCAIALR